MPYIEVIPLDKATGDLKEIYENLIKTRGKLAGVHTIQSLNPKTIVAHMELYMSIMFSQSPLSRAQREMIAVVVSKTNRCDYCIQHHSTALNHFWKSTDRIKNFIEDINAASLTYGDRQLCYFAEQLTLNAEFCNHKLSAAELKRMGFNDRAVLDATLVVAYFNFVNRIVLALGVNLEQEGTGGYNFD